MEQKIREALSKLDPSDEGHWTTEGLPRMDVVEKLVGDPLIKRKDVSEVMPGFNRASLVKEDTDEAQTAENEAPPETEVVAEEKAVDPADPNSELREQLQAELADVEAELAEFALGLEQALKHRDEISARANSLRDRIQNEVGPIPFAKAVRDYQASQLEIRRRRFAGAVPTSGKSPLDQAMAPKRGHGLARPAVQPLAVKSPE